MGRHGRWKGTHNGARILCPCPCPCVRACTAPLGRPTPPACLPVSACLPARSVRPPGSLACLRRVDFGAAFCNKGLALLLPLPGLQELALSGIDTVTDATMAQVRMHAAQLPVSPCALHYSGGAAACRHGKASPNPLFASLPACRLHNRPA